jgi:hypothetical protein
MQAVTVWRPLLFSFRKLVHEATHSGQRGPPWDHLLVMLGYDVQDAIIFRSQQYLAQFKVSKHFRPFL